MAKGFLFDFDGTLYGDANLWSEIIVETLSQFGIPATTRDALDRARQMIEKDGGTNGTIRISAVASDLAHDQGVQRDDDVKSRFFEILDKHMDQDGPSRALVSLLQYLQGKQISLGIVTFVRRPRITHRLAVWNLANFFGATITPDDVPDFKPSPLPFLTAMDRLHVRPSECVVVGDEPVDMIGGKKAGATAIGLPQGFFSRQELERAGADHILTSLKQLPTYIHEQNLVSREHRHQDMSTNQALAKVLNDTGLAQFGDALVNFAISIALTEQTGQPRGMKVPDKVLAEAAVQAGLRKYLPKRLGRGEVANSVEALLGHAWLTKVMTLEEISASLRAANLTQAESFAKLAGIALSRFKT